MSREAREGPEPPEATHVAVIGSSSLRVIGSSGSLVLEGRAVTGSGQPVGTSPSPPQPSSGRLFAAMTWRYQL